jgi:hypothetical protein
MHCLAAAGEGNGVIVCAHASFLPAALAPCSCGVGLGEHCSPFAPSSLKCTVVPVHKVPSPKPHAGIRRESIDGPCDEPGRVWRPAGSRHGCPALAPGRHSNVVRCDASDAGHTRRAFGRAQCLDRGLSRAAQPDGVGSLLSSRLGHLSRWCLPGGSAWPALRLL